jgi:hypothetical protein
VNVLDEMKNLRCGPIWCFGDGVEEGAVVQKPDGSDRKIRS